MPTRLSPAAIALWLMRSRLLNKLRDRALRVHISETDALHGVAALVSVELVTRPPTGRAEALKAFFQLRCEWRRDVEAMDVLFHTEWLRVPRCVEHGPFRTEIVAIEGMPTRAFDVCKTCGFKQPAPARGCLARAVE